jgi:hypothetical protein
MSEQNKDKKVLKREVKKLKKEVKKTKKDEDSDYEAFMADLKLDDTNANSSDDGKPTKRARIFKEIDTGNANQHAYFPQTLAMRTEEETTRKRLEARKRSYFTPSANNNSQETYEEYANPFFSRQDANKRSKKTHYSAEVVVEIEDRHGNLVPIRALIDTGTSSSIVLREFVRKGRAKSYKGQTTKWSTLGGVFQTKRKALIDFSLPELSTQKKVTSIFHVDDKTDKDQAQFDMIIGMDLLTKLGYI